METALITQSPGLMQLHKVVLLAITAAHFIDDASASYLKSPPSGTDQDAEGTDGEDRMPKGPGFFKKFTRSRQETLPELIARLENEAKQPEEEIAANTAAVTEQLRQLFLNSRVPPQEILTNLDLMGQYISLRNRFQESNIPDLKQILRDIYDDEKLREIIAGGKSSSFFTIREVADELEMMLGPPHQGETSG
ncbi:hypothetical protein PsorP6_010504 [Peronosclerospora sorghi]|uniref:Uncharacterized protein n=1 Tax=Peronosclerospora sorghi TaxID=230839 RepID=A0ACC0VYY0_9STRA|nr:hypothetical protein PsorP6_010504 [Peronosclerospora sorghi]